MQSRPDNSAEPAGDAREPHAFPAGDDEIARLHEIYRPAGSPMPVDECPMALTLKEQRPIGGREILVERPDGTRRHVIPYPQPHRSASGSMVGAVNMLVDITDYKTAQRALRDSEDRFRRCFERGRVGMAVASPLEHVLEVNDELCRILGYERAELLGRTWADLTHPDDLAADRSHHERLVAGEIDGYSLDKRFIRKDGGVVDCITAARCQRRLDGAVDYFVGLVQDITGRSRAAAEATALKNALAEELAAMTRLHAFSTRLLAETDIQHLLEEVLDAIVALLSADLGILQLYNSATRTLDIAVYRGFETDFVDRFKSVGADSGTACARALREQQRVIIEDVDTDPAFGQYRDAALAAGFRAVQSTPMFSRGAQPLGVISTYSRRPHRPSDDLLRMTDLYAGQAAEMIESKQTESALRTYQHELQELTTRLIEAQEIQSKHLARELHDVFSQRLAAIGMELARLADTLEPSPATLRAPLLALTAQVGVLAKDIHGIARQMHPAILDDLGLPAAIRSECLAFSAQYEIPAEFTSDNIPYAIPEDVALCLYRIAQESLRNIAKHAGASQVSVRLVARPRELVLAIGDVGVGIDAEIIKGKRGLGLVSMEERLRIVGGTLSIRSQQGAGTHVKATVPIAS